MATNQNVAAKSGQAWKWLGWITLAVTILVIVISIMSRIGNKVQENPRVQGVAPSSLNHIELNQGDPIKWVSIPQRTCYEVNLAKEGECVTSYINSEQNPRPLCQGKPEHIDTAVFRLGLSSSHKTVATVDLFSCE